MNIICSNLSIGYQNIILHKNINFTISHGSYTCVIGENGVGKSTLIKTLLGLLEPLEGNIIFQEGLKARDIGYLPQQTQAQKDFPASVFEVTISGCINKMGLRPFYTKQERELALSMLEKLNIADLYKKSYSELSGGQQQRVLLARALCATNKALLLDEPTAGLDSQGTKEFYSLIKSLNNEGITILMITHNLKEVIDDASSILSITKQGIESLSVDAYQRGME